MEYTGISLSWSDIPELAVHIRIFWQRVAAKKKKEGSYWTNGSYWLSWSHHRESFTVLVTLKSSLWKFYDHQHDLVNRYRISMSQMTTDMFDLS
jgi:hypothetical protein